MRIKYAWDGNVFEVLPPWVQYQAPNFEKDIKLLQANVQFKQTFTTSNCKIILLKLNKMGEEGSKGFRMFYVFTCIVLFYAQTDLQVEP